MSLKKRVLIVDDDIDSCDALRQSLGLYEEFEVASAENGTEALRVIHSRNYDLILLDVELPDIDGRELCRLMRRAGIKVPIIMLTAVDGEADVIRGLDAGANDYVIKPLRFGVLLARIRAQLRQHEESDDAVFKIGHFRFNPGAKILVDQLDEHKVRLTAKETAILKYLYRASDKVVDRETLLKELWDYNASVTTHTLEQHIYRLRQKLEVDPSSARILQSQGGGYRLIP